MNYQGIVYRPPSEAGSLIVQVTIGCSQNGCTFCSMYKDKNFHIRNIDEILTDFKEARELYKNISKIFLADGDALICKADMLIKILDFIKEYFPECKQISCYASAKSILLKSEEELKTLKDKGLKMVYLGLESGSDKILKRVKKGVTSKEMIEAANKIHNAGIMLSVTAISGLGGYELWEEHAVETGKTLSKMNPQYIGLLTLMIEPGVPLENEIKKGTFKVMDPYDILKETKLLIENLNCDNAVFRANHASNYVNLKGTLNKDKKELINKLNAALEGKEYIKEEYMRGL
ncbi:B12-binding domain-containing radical SAM protein [Anaerofustis stercorihominis]|uniref:Radical SAM domain protein n=1 Tax=Anaerofustis stercorihominis DSM 17244 TaxID=445971 RepID=B1CAG1_9FIRM|nr:radical SAM protein [Anaerofustis stercorihominis]EDS72434.1 radical SAM domain protein [Anaerofustis stercorihominis DSM 17244]MCQ4795323.1 B12-binding domain-containing radical SAM protein [Anaerofustis stercorihominis]